MEPRGNFLYIPDKNLLEGQLYELDDGGTQYRTNSFVAVPYSEPRMRPPRPVYYGILNSKRIEAAGPVENVYNGIVSPGLTRDTYIGKVMALKEEIQKGNIYEVNFCMRFSAAFRPDPFALFRKLCETSKAPYMMMAKLGNEYVMCASPELFLRKEGARLYTKPIKGTKRRGAGVQEDVELRDALFYSEKDRTENVMAVDVARNDLSIVAKKGSVEVNKLYNIETFETVHQMVSTVSCEIGPDIPFEKIIEATFPMASMTGAPKRKAMQLIGETEGFDRHYYSGTMGIINHSGDYTLPVLIRSIFYDQMAGETWFAAGGAITSLSDPAEEYEECLLKAQGILKALGAAPITA